jgi:hypothetical protein
MLDVYVHILRHVSQIVNTRLTMLAHIFKIDWCNQSLNQLKILTTHKMFKSLYSLQFALIAEKTCQLINHPQKDYLIWANKNAHYDASEIKNTNLQLKHNHHPKHKNIHSSTATCWEVHIKSNLCHASIFKHVHSTPHLFEFQGNPILLPHLGIQNIDRSRNQRGSQKKVKKSKFQLAPDRSNYHASWSAFAHLQKNLEEKTIVSKQCSVGKRKKELSLTREFHHWSKPSKATRLGVTDIGLKAFWDIRMA